MLVIVIVGDCSLDNEKVNGCVPEPAGGPPERECKLRRSMNLARFFEGGGIQSAYSPLLPVI